MIIFSAILMYQLCSKNVVWKDVIILQYHLHAIVSNIFYEMLINSFLNVVPHEIVKVRAQMLYLMYIMCNLYALNICTPKTHQSRYIFFLKFKKILKVLKFIFNFRLRRFLQLSLNHGKGQRMLHPTSCQSVVKRKSNLHLNILLNPHHTRRQPKLMLLSQLRVLLNYPKILVVMLHHFIRLLLIQTYTFILVKFSFKICV